MQFHPRPQGFVMVGLDGVRGRRYGVRMAMLHKTQKIEVYWVAHWWDWDVGFEGVAGAMGRASWWPCCRKVRVGNPLCKLVSYLILSTSIGCAHIVPGIAPKAPTHPCCKHLMGSIVVMGLGFLSGGGQFVGAFVYRVF